MPSADYRFRGNDVRTILNAVIPNLIGNLRAFMHPPTDSHFHGNDAISSMGLMFALKYVAFFYRRIRQLAEKVIAKYIATMTMANAHILFLCHQVDIFA